ncbi:hypothetical protein ACJZ2D_016994 [Fusarium nematophilum]
MPNRLAAVAAAISLASTLASALQQPIQASDHSQGYQFDALLHLPGISPYFDAVGFGLSHAAPEGCTVNAASYLIRHAAIYANDAEYEAYIKPFLFKLEKHRGGFSGPLEVLNKWYSSIDEDHLEDVTPSGKRDAEEVGRHLAKRYRHLASSVKRVVADTKARTYDTAVAFTQAFPDHGSIEFVRFNKSHLNDGTRALLPHKACSVFSKDPGTEQQEEFLGVYDAEWLSYEYAWDMNFPWLYSQSQLFDSIDDPDANHNETTGWPSGQRLFFSFTHREVPPFVATALGIFNSSSREGYDEFPTSHVNHVRAWKMSDLIPFLGHVGMEKMTCEIPGVPDEEFIRFIANTAPRPLPLCQNGPGASCAFEEFKKIVSSGMERYGDFDRVCENTSGDEL